MPLAVEHVDGQAEALRHMSPSLAMYYEVYTGIRDPEFRTQLFHRQGTRRPEQAYLPHAIVGEFGVQSNGLATLSHLIGRVLLAGREKEMVRPNAHRRIAVMAHAHPDRNWPVMKHPREAMRQFSSARSAQTKRTIPTATPSPNPTTDPFLDVLPEPGLGRRPMTIKSHA